jgi:hypothetical protein
VSADPQGSEVRALQERVEWYSEELADAERRAAMWKTAARREQVRVRSLLKVLARVEARAGHVLELVGDWKSNDRKRQEARRKEMQ